MFKNSIFLIILIISTNGLSNAFKDFSQTFSIISSECFENNLKVECLEADKESIQILADNSVTYIKIGSGPSITLETFNRREMNEKASFINAGVDKARWEYQRLLSDRYGHMKIEKRFVEIHKIKGTTNYTLIIKQSLENVSKYTESSKQVFILEVN